MKRSSRNSLIIIGLFAVAVAAAAGVLRPAPPPPSCAHLLPFPPGNVTHTGIHQEAEASCTLGRGLAIVAIGKKLACAVFPSAFFLTEENLNATSRGFSAGAKLVKRRRNFDDTFIAAIVICFSSQAAGRKSLNKVVTCLKGSRDDSV